jgi:hypothetical protein
VTFLGLFLNRSISSSSCFLWAIRRGWAPEGGTNTSARPLRSVLSLPLSDAPWGGGYEPYPLCSPGPGAGGGSTDISAPASLTRTTISVWQQEPSAQCSPKMQSSQEDKAGACSPLDTRTETRQALQRGTSCSQARLSGTTPHPCISVDPGKGTLLSHTSSMK